MPKKILVVEDDPDYLIALERTLGQKYDVDTVKDGNAAVAALEKPYDLLVMDIMLPQKSGFLVLEKLREHVPRSRPPYVILITGNQGARHRQYGQSLGAHGYVNKPFRMDWMAGLVDKFLDHELSESELERLFRLSQTPDRQPITEKEAPVALNSLDAELDAFDVLVQSAHLDDCRMLPRWMRLTPYIPAGGKSSVALSLQSGQELKKCGAGDPPEHCVRYVTDGLQFTHGIIFHGHYYVGEHISLEGAVKAEIVAFHRFMAPLTPSEINGFAVGIHWKKSRLSPIELPLSTDFLHTLRDGEIVFTPDTSLTKSNYVDILNNALGSANEYIHRIAASIGEKPACFRIPK